MTARPHRIVLFALITALLPASLQAARPIPLDELFPPKIVARGNGFQVSEKEVEKAYLDYRTAASANGQNLDPTERTALEIKLLDKLIFMRIMLLKAKDEDRQRGSQRAGELLDAFKKRSSSEDAFRRYIDSLGLTYEEFKSKFMDQAVVEEVLLREVHSKITVSDEEMKRFYLDNLKAFQQPEMVRASHILISSRDLKQNRSYDEKEKRAALIKAEALLKRARAGEDFAQLVSNFSEDPGSKQHGGVYAFARGQMALEFEAAAFALQPGQISDVVETGYGFHIIKLLDRRPVRTVPYESAQDRVRKAVIDQKAEARLPAYTEQIKTDYRTEILDAKYRVTP